MQIQEFFTPGPENADQFSFTREQASRFAKFVANDYNPIHDVDAKRFCVPGDLLFAISLAKAGLSQSMKVDFTDMVTDGIQLSLQAAEAGQHQLTGDNDKCYLKLTYSGEHSENAELISKLSESYVAYSGLTFPHILVPLMREQNVMINPARPLVIYEGAELELERLDLNDAELVGAESKLLVEGKRGTVTLGFDIVSNGTRVGHGEKRMVLSGLREFDEQAMTDVVAYYKDRQTQFVDA
ncbi:DUF3581 family protein [Pseudoteredinibacter isoporae]|uniref:DUF3581 domain-containing protein n=1 Tax=Pseudoteredinibacter isoporae TaxID=570281 RepID=A0A7X0JQK4_9GAMM|nr:DUF3581 family protein [Pseudoteredinibacter isoporae]MBB6520464.1 hypothetical protein [Pseudoteredinibacter isoporae]NHO86031.1 DUF3581 domain-containing protein [Pseudoteredinibacter isoporae]NIB25518.1 DUF3581 domain-containing protein [Pseudoteredinibacter isoporae]